MTKRQLIDEIIAVNQSAQPEFLAGFEDPELGEYLENLRSLDKPVLLGDAARYERYFASPAKRPSQPLPEVEVATAVLPVEEETEPVESAPAKEPAELAAVGATAEKTSTPFASSETTAHSWRF